MRSKRAWSNKFRDICVVLWFCGCWCGCWMWAWSWGQILRSDICLFTRMLNNKRWMEAQYLTYDEHRTFLPHSCMIWEYFPTYLTNSQIQGKHNLSHHNIPYLFMAILSLAYDSTNCLIEEANTNTTDTQSLRHKLVLHIHCKWSVLSAR